MRTGLDYAWAHVAPGAITAAGYSFACRYLSRDAAKNLTAAEGATLAAAGIDVVANWEAVANAAAKGYNQGVADATQAQAEALGCGMPTSRPIYFSVDYDVPDMAPSSSDPVLKLGPVAEYFRGVASVFGVNRTGAYGGYWAIRRLFDAGLITWGWQTYAWSGGQWDSRAQLRQVRNGIEVGGVDCDADEAHAADFGQWRPVGFGPNVPTPQAGTQLGVDGKLGPLTVKRWQQVIGTTADGVISTPSELVRAVQRRLNAALGAGLVEDGIGIRQDGHRYKTVDALQHYLGTTRDGMLSAPVSECVKALQRHLNNGRF